LEMARQAASLIMVCYQEQPHEMELRADRGDLYTPQRFVPGGVPDTESGDVEACQGRFIFGSCSLLVNRARVVHHNGFPMRHAHLPIFALEPIFTLDHQKWPRAKTGCCAQQGTAPCSQ